MLVIDDVLYQVYTYFIIGMLLHFAGSETLLNDDASQTNIRTKMIIEKFIICTAFSSLGNFIGCWFFANFINARGLKEPIQFSAYLNLFNITLCSYTIRYHNLPLFFFTKFLGGVFQSSDLVWSTESIYTAKDQGELFHTHSLIREGLYGFISILVYSIFNLDIFTITSEKIIYKIFDVYWLMSLCTCIMSHSYIKSSICYRREWINSLGTPITFRIFKIILPFFLFQVSYGIGSLIIPAMSEFFLGYDGGPALTAKIELGFEAFAFIYSLFSLLFKSRFFDNFSRRISIISLIIWPFLFRFFGRPSYLNILMLYGVLDVIFNTNTLNKISQQYSLEIPHLCALMNLSTSLAQLLITGLCYFLKYFIKDNLVQYFYLSSFFLMIMFLLDNNYDD